MTNNAILTGEQEGQKVRNEKVKKIDTRDDNFTYRLHASRWTYRNQIWHKGSRGWYNRIFQILSKSVGGGGFQAVRDQKFPIDFDSCP